MTETLHPRYSNESVIPTVKSQAFVDNPMSRFAIGMVGMGDDVYYPEEKLAYHRLRAGVYAKQTGMIPLDRINEDGGEYDSDDSRSAHMCIVENRGEEQRVVASMRLIVRQGGIPLPIEKHFPDVFSGASAPDFSTEVSRYIARHEDARLQDALRWPTFRRALAHIANYNLGPTYAIVEPFLERKLRMAGVPCAPLADPEFVAEYNEYNLPIMIDTAGLIERVRSEDPEGFGKMTEDEKGFSHFGFMPRELAKRLSRLDEQS